ncbi:MAG: beta-lactamase family protein, partial [Acidobacteria bacterium]|nr:beta-lactamase family protein [Acidobacteriota bacterium]
MKRLSCLLLLASLPLLAEGELPKAHVARIDEVVAAAIEAKEIPGAVLVVGRNGKVVLEKVYGNRALVPVAEPMTLDTVFDLASLTKPVATAASILALVEEGRLRLQDRVVTVLPEFGKGGGLRDKVTVEDLLVHRAGLLPDDPMRLYVGTPAEIFARKHAQPLTGRPGEKFVYSDAGFEVLAEIVRAVSGKPLDVYSKERIFEPLGMKETGFLPLAGTAAIPLSRIAPTEVENGVPFRGVVHDPRARALGGVAGHAGLFSTASDLARYAAFLLGDARGPLSPATIAELTRPRVYGDLDVRALGWDVSTSFSTSRGDLFPPGSFGHTGWTGTSMWLDPETRTFVILLSNRNHPDESGNAQPVRSRVATIVASALGGDPMKLRKAGERLADKVLASASASPARGARPDARPAATVAPPAPAEVLSGLDVLEASGFAALAGKRIAVLTNQTGLT